MSRFAKLFAANAIAAAGLCSAAVALSASAAADPVILPSVPGVPALNMIQQFATNPASMGAVLQTAATALNGASTLVGAPAPNALPVSPIQGAPGVPVMPAAPVAPATAPIGTAPTIGPLLSQLGVPANLVGLAPTDLPIIGSQAGLSPVAPLAPVAAPLPVAPVAPAIPAVAPAIPAVAPAIPAVAPAIPAVAPAIPDGGALNPLPLLTALP
jgi:hypothetical protein